ncbi:MAG: type II secretion system F family protein [Clostridiales bacterium]|nr:type II secretion system F family protein [Clostridiales bacterium]MCF8022684.1 type II secretion system F family protein [Clostridiales bacterium]
MLFLVLGLFSSLFACLFLLIVPTGVYSTSPSLVTVDMVRNKLRQKVTEGDKAKKLAIINRTPEDIIKLGLFTGIGLFLIVFFVGNIFIGTWAIPIAIISSIAGIYLAEYMADNEYKKWQARLFEGVPVLVNFIPAFLAVGTITPRQALEYTIPFLPEPLKGEMTDALDLIKRKHNVKEALNRLAIRAKDPTINSICSRLATAWNSSVSPDMFEDLSEEIENLQELAAARKTTLKGGMIAVIGVISLGGAVLIYGYPAWCYVLNKFSGGFGF